MQKRSRLDGSEATWHRPVVYSSEHLYQGKSSFAHYRTPAAKQSLETLTEQSPSNLLKLDAEWGN